MGFWEGAGKVAKEIATGIWGSGGAKALSSNLGEMSKTRIGQLESSAIDDLMNTMSANGIKFAEKVTYGGEEVATRDAFRKIAKSLDENRDMMAAYLERSAVEGDMGKKVIQEAIENYKKDGEKLTKYFKDGKSVEAASEYLGKKDGAIGPWNMAAGYFGDEVNGATRGKTVAAGVAGTGVVIRYLSGGNLTTTPQGERDIAGIPFI